MIKYEERFIITALLSSLISDTKALSLLYTCDVVQTRIKSMICVCRHRDERNALSKRICICV
jgi:hypothetical protein